MTIDFKELRKTVIDSVKASIGDKLSQTVNPQTQESYGTVFNARPNPALPVPEYPYAVVDITGIDDVDWYLKELIYDEDSGSYYYETEKLVTLQISIYGGDAIALGNELSTSYRRYDILDILSHGGLGVADVQQVQINPELLQTDWLEASFVDMTVRVKDITYDQNLDSIEYVIVDGVLDCAATGELELTASTFSYPVGSFVLEINTELGDGSNTFGFSLNSASTYNFEVDWGDGTVETITTSDDVSHTYESQGVWIIQISGDFPRAQFNGLGYGEVLVDLVQWGDTGFTNLASMFLNCTNMLGTYTDVPNLSNVDNMISTFNGCSVFDGQVAGWDTSNIRLFNGTWSRCSAFNQDLSRLKFDSVQSMAGMLNLSQSWSTENYDKLLNSLANQSNVLGITNVNFGCSSEYTISESGSSKDFLVDDQSWTITDLGGV